MRPKHMDNAARKCRVMEYVAEMFPAWVRSEPTDLRPGGVLVHMPGNRRITYLLWWNESHNTLEVKRLGVYKSFSSAV